MGKKKRRVPLATEPPSATAYRRVIDELLELHASQTGIRIGHAKAQRLVTLHGLLEHVFNVTSDALSLLDSGRRASVPVLARVAYEHALVAQWVHRHPGGLEGLFNKNSKTRHRFIKGARKIENLGPFAIEAIQDLPEYVEPPSGLQNMRNTCDAFVPQGQLYLVYSVLSSWVHPCAATTWNYVQETGLEEAPYALKVKPPDDDPLPLLLALAYATVWASGVYEDIRKTKPNKARVQDIAATIGIRPLMVLQESSK